MNASTLSALYAEHHDQALDHLTRQLRNVDPADVEDALADAWVILARMPDSYLRPAEDGARMPDSYLRPAEDGGSLAGWLMVTARRQALKRRYRPGPDALDRQQPSGGGGDEGRSMADHPARARCARAAVELLRDESITLAKRRGIAAMLLGLSAAQYMAATGETYTSWNRKTAEGRKLARELLRDLAPTGIGDDA